MQTATENKVVPKLRFRDFENSWNRFNLKDITSYVDYRGRAPIKSNDGHFLVTAKNIKKGFIDFECSKEYVADENYATVMSKGLPKIGDVLFTTEAPLGNVAQVNINNIALAQRVIKFRGNDKLDNTYLLYYMLCSSFRKYIFKKANGSTVEGISGKELHKSPIGLPSVCEQQKIASFLSAVDEKIQKLTKKKELLSDYKKGAMQKIFSQELRFKDANGNNYPDWEEKKMGAIGETFNGLTGKTKVDFGRGKPFIQYMQIFNSAKIDTSKFGYVDINEGEKQKTAKYGDVFFTTSSETPLEIGYASVLTEEIEEVYLNSFCFGYRPNSLTELYPDFSSYLFRSEFLRKQIVKLAQGSTRYNMSKVQLMKVLIQLPSLDEQQKIANFLSSLDSKIELVSTQIENSKAFKKGLLQQMFV